MSEENIELVRRLSDAWNRGELSEVLEGLTDDVVADREQPDGATFHGKEGLLEMALDWVEGFAEWTMANEEYIAAGDSVVVRVRQTGVGEASGARVVGDYWFVFTVRDGKIARLGVYAQKATALEAAGVRD